MKAEEVYFYDKISAFKCKPLSLIFGIRNNKIQDLIRHHISVQIKIRYYQIEESNRKISISHL